MSGNEALTREHGASTMHVAMPDLPTIKELAFKHKIDARTLRKFFAGKMPKGRLVRAACEKAAREWRSQAAPC